MFQLMEKYMQRWADLLIKSVQKDTKGRIIQVEVAIDTILDITGAVILTKNQIITILKDGAKIKTIYDKYDNGKYIEGASVEFYTETNGEEYLRTKSNKTDKDNLDNLPTF